MMRIESRSTAKHRSGRTRPHPQATLAILALTHVLLATDFTVVYVALPQVALELGFTAHRVQWIVHAYTIVFGSVLIFGGRCADYFGSLKVFLAGLSILAIASMVGALASTPMVAVAARGLQGFAAGLIFPSMLALLRITQPDGHAGMRAVSIWSASGPLGLAFGCILGGTLVDLLGWQSVFYFNVPFAMAGIIAAFWWIDDSTSQNTAARRALNAPATAVLTAAISLLIYALVDSTEPDWRSSMAILPVSGTVAFAALFIFFERHNADPVLPAHLFRVRNLLVGTLLVGLIMGTFMSLPYFQTTLYQNTFGYSSVATGFAFLVPCVFQAVGARVCLRLVGCYGLRLTVASGLFLGIAGVIGMSVGLYVGEGYAYLVPGLVLSSFGQGIAWAGSWIAVTSSTEPAEQGTASGLASTSFQIGGAIGLATMIALVHRMLGPVEVGAKYALHSMQLAILVATAGILIAFFISLRFGPVSPAPQN